MSKEGHILDSSYQPHIEIRTHNCTTTPKINLVCEDFFNFYNPISSIETLKSHTFSTYHDQKHFFYSWVVFFSKGK
jgi:hypothetical protein